MAASLPKPGDLIAGRYRIEALLGQGGMGAVLAAVDEHLGRPVAIKWMLGTSAVSERGVARFFAEARAMARIEHPNVAHVIDVQYDGVPFMVMERLRGESLEERLKAGPLPMARAIDVLLEACRGVAAAHAEGIVHRDLKPANIFLCRGKDGSPRPVKVLDFGVAKLTDDGGGPKLSVTGIPIGTPHYMSPQHLDARPPNPSFDVYSLGVVLYQLLAGRLPFGSQGLVGLIEEIHAGTPPAIRQLAPHVPAELEALALRAMHRDETRRGSLAQLIDDLTRIRAGLVSAPEAALQPRLQEAPTLASPRPNSGAPMAFAETVGVSRSAPPTRPPPDPRAPGPRLAAPAPPVQGGASRAALPPAKPTGWARRAPLIGGLVMVLSAMTCAIGGGAAWVLGQGETPEALSSNPSTSDPGEPASGDAQVDDLETTGQCASLSFAHPLRVAFSEPDNALVISWFDVQRETGSSITVRTSDTDETVVFDRTRFEAQDIRITVGSGQRMWTTDNLADTEEQGRVVLHEFSAERGVMHAELENLALTELLGHTTACRIDGTVDSYRRSPESER